MNTDAHGYVGLKFDDDLGVFVFTVNAENIGNVTGIYVYKDDKNQNGSVVLDLLKAEKERKVNDIKKSWRRLLLLPPNLIFVS